MQAPCPSPGLPSALDSLTCADQPCLHLVNKSLRSPSALLFPHPTPLTSLLCSVPVSRAVLSAFLGLSLVCHQRLIIAE